MNGTHGRVGGNLFLVAYVLATLGPLVEVWSGAQWGVRSSVLGVVLAAGVIAIITIRRYGGGGAGEPLGLLAGAIAWLGRLGGPALASRLAVPSSGVALWAALGSALAVLLTAVGLWLASASRNRPGAAERMGGKGNSGE